MKILEHNITFYFFAFFSFVYLFIGYNNGINIYDEGLTTYGAVRILHGDVPYKDFWSIYAPGQFYLLAGLFYTFGISIPVERVLSVFIMFGLSLGSFFMIKKNATQTVALLGWLIIVPCIDIDARLFYGTPIITALLFAILSCYYVLTYFEKQNRSALLYAGIATGCTALFRHDLGFYLTVSEAIILTLFIAFGTAERSNKTLMNKLKALLPLFSGMAIILFPILIYFLFNVPVKDLLFDLVIFPVTIFPKFRSIPFPAFTIASDRIPLFFPFIIVGIEFCTLVYRYIRHSINWNEKRIWGELFLLLLTLTLINQSLVRFGFSHVLPSYFPATALFILLFFHNGLRGIKRVIVITIGLWIGFLILKQPIEKKRDTIKEYFSTPTIFTFDVEPAKGIRWEGPGSTYQELIRYVQKEVPRGEYIFSCNSQHDRICYNDIIFHVLSGYESPTKYYELHPGLVTTASVQAEIINNLQVKKVNYLVMLEQQCKEENEAGKSSGIVLLDTFIRQEYQPLQQFGIFTVWKRKTGVL